MLVAVAVTLHRTCWQLHRYIAAIRAMLPLLQCQLHVPEPHHCMLNRCMITAQIIMHTLDVLVYIVSCL